eukprot:10164786-Alexandrium_andersonii.AAC.1
MKVADLRSTLKEVHGVEDDGSSDKTALTNVLLEADMKKQKGEETQLLSSWSDTVQHFFDGE